MLKRGVVTFVFRSREKALELCDKGNWILYFIFNSIHLFHEKLNVKHLDGHCREIFCFFQRESNTFIILRVYWYFTFTVWQKLGLLQSVHTEDAKMGTVGEENVLPYGAIFFPENSGLQKGKKVFLRILFKSAYFWVADKLLKLLYLKLFCSLILRFNSTCFVKSKAKQNFDEKK